MTSMRVEFSGAEKTALVGVLELPEHGEPQAYAVFAHCFTCGKNSVAAARISRALAAQGIATLRFDFTGLGDSAGEFGNAGFVSNVADLVAAANWMQATHGTPSLLIGHSLGGTAALMAAPKLDYIKAVCTVGAPASASEVLKHFAYTSAPADGNVQVTLGGRQFALKPSFIEELGHHTDTSISRQLRRALLVMHAPRDEVVDIDQASLLFTSALHPKSFVSLDDADHLITRSADAAYVADTIATWARRYVPHADKAADGSPSDLREGDVWIGEHDHAFWREMHASGHHIDADEPKTVGGGGHGPTPYDLLLMSLGACTSMTLRLYANRKGYKLEDVQVRLRHERLHAKDCAECDGKEGKVERITRELFVRGSLSEEQRADLLRIADRCPVHRTLEGDPVIVTRLTHDQ